MTFLDDRGEPDEASVGSSGRMFRNNIPGLVNVYKKRWKDPPFFIGKSTITMENHHF